MQRVRPQIFLIVISAFVLIAGLVRGKLIISLEVPLHIGGRVGDVFQVPRILSSNRLIGNGADDLQVSMVESPGRPGGAIVSLWSKD